MKKNIFEKKIKEPHVCIHIFDDDTVCITESAKKILEGVDDISLPGPINTYDQAVWTAGNTCVWFRGKRY
ncbi:MAG: hypothetical protein U9Q05_10460 [Thermodesulfobacteriota bacterium]|nr:hypothetical protein [Thermodesulfobacteriota bacterium]